MTWAVHISEIGNWRRVQERRVSPAVRFQGAAKKTVIDADSKKLVLMELSG